MVYAIIVGVGVSFDYKKLKKKLRKEARDMFKRTVDHSTWEDFL
jgi:hypothetical protein